MIDEKQKSRLEIQVLEYNERLKIIDLDIHSYKIAGEGIPIELLDEWASIHSWLDVCKRVLRNNGIEP